MKIAFGCDHAAFEHRDKVIDVLKAQGHTIDDFGHKGKTSCDYPDVAAAVAGSVSKGKNEKGILICGTGVGMSIAANKFPGVRAAVCWNKSVAALVAEHNDANILAMGGRVVGTGLAAMILDVWLSTEFAGGRHARRIGKIAAYEQGGPCKCRRNSSASRRR